VILRTVHLLAAVVWVGGMIFFSVVIMPAVRQALLPSQRQELVRIVGRRYRAVGWVSVGVLLATGSVMAWRQGVDWGSPFGRVLMLKLSLVVLMVALTATHDFVLGPRAAQAGNPDAERSRRAVIWLARMNLLVVLAIVVCGVWLSSL
jgi:putative copper export protein